MMQSFNNRIQSAISPNFFRINGNCQFHTTFNLLFKENTAFDKDREWQFENRRNNPNSFRQWKGGFSKTGNGAYSKPFNNFNRPQRFRNYDNLTWNENTKLTNTEYKPISEEKWSTFGVSKDEDSDINNFESSSIQDKNDFKFNARLTPNPNHADLQSIESFLKTEFSEFPNLDRRLIRNLTANNMSVSSPIQRYTYALSQTGYDILASSETGSGKTIAFLTPIMNDLLSVYPRDAFQLQAKVPSCLAFPTALVLCPTRELALQIHGVAIMLLKQSPVRCQVVYGGDDIRKQTNRLQNGGCNLLIATPGRLNDMLDQEFISLAALRHLVLDETDRMLDMGFEPQIMKILLSPRYRAVSADVDVDQAGLRRSNMFFSATIPHEITSLVRHLINKQHSQSEQSSQRRPLIQLSLDTQHNSDVLARDIVDVRQSNQQRETEASLSGSFLPQNIELEFCRESSIQTTLSSLTKTVSTFIESNQRPVLIFANQKVTVSRLEAVFHKQGIPISQLHGDMSQSARERSLNAFRNGETSVMIASEVAARGLDIIEVGLVVNFGLPVTLDSFVHRVGRTGRMGRLGKCVTFVLPEDEGNVIVKSMVKLLRQNGRLVPEALK